MRVVAVVVTYNRKELLTRCLNALLDQSIPLSTILVIDNASTDGTKEHLARAGLLERPSVEYRTMTSNLGGAGGFQKGFEAARAEGFDLLWVMDDDGMPDRDCLKQLLAVDGDARAPVILDDKDSGRTAFFYEADGRHTNVAQHVQGARAVLPLHPFNGVLLSARLVEAIGVPDGRFFLWGDEIEYRQRWLASGFAEMVAPAAIFYHPSDRMMVRSNSRYSMGVPQNASDIRRYCYYRNRAFLYYRSLNPVKRKLLFAFSLLDVIVQRSDARLFANAWKAGISGDFSRHTHYLKS
jgi:rhamnopyranosyl-N-acetylglucosaminyl-diphospho-decaprenol beta-1,3/1,4-galactofuranosyltransferase